MTFHSFRTRLMATAGGLSIALAAAAAAQAADAPPRDAGVSQVGEVVVTAQKRTERLQDVPTAVTVLNAADLVAKNAVSLDDYFRSVPGLTLYDNGEGFMELVIRGVTTGNGDTPTVGIYIDDTPIGSSTALARGDVLVPDLDPSDLQRVEVLKGPQGTLYGASNMGGLLKYITVAPDLNTFSGRVGVEGETVEKGGAGYAVRAAVNLPLIKDDLALRISGSMREDPGFVDNVANGDRNVNDARVFNGRAALLWRPTDTFQIKLSALFQNRNGYGETREDYNFLTGKPIYGDLKQSRVPGINSDRERLEQYNATIEDDLGWATLTSSTSYAKNHYYNLADLSSLFSPIFAPAFGIPDLGVELVQSFGTQKITQEVRLASRSDAKIEWLAGVFYTHESSTFYQKFNPVQTENGQAIQGLPLFALDVGRSHYQEIAGFGDVTYHFTPKFDVQAGVRYSYNNQDSHDYNNGLLDGTLTPILGAGTSHEGVTTFLFTPEYKFTDSQMIYGRIASGYRAGGPNYTLAGAETPFLSDSTVNYEVGFKSELLDRQAYVEMDAFYITWSRIQLLGVNSLDEEFFTNAGAAVSQGFEFSGQYRPVHGLTLAANLTYSDAHLTEDAPSGIYAPSGSRLPYSPRWSGQISANYEFPLVADWKGSIGGDYSYTGDRISDFQSSASIARITLPAYSVVNLQAGVRNERYSVNLFVKNVADERGFTAANALTLSKTPASYAVSVIQPRTVGVSLAAKF
ncbi:MAG: TonB-dependent receptor [Caulobacteraceae bacterium]|nr:TonB-dependent receptor [Caulobacteraceae bacterium]